ncbi:unnamed protein product [Notodromas monacha]|uniref:Tetratricopeptide repeat protein 5 OB fold domain-containing protein n=1 Tax=Notodromas monacha TaxID=399045 RepID=A0A7R9GAX0_9CRUS|nr:unnamed protein product [Notodromas monacha]CAG0915703.1 unnamed protein product [Notodromas monacha]
MTTGCVFLKDEWIHTKKAVAILEKFINFNLMYFDKFPFEEAHLKTEKLTAEGNTALNLLDAIEDECCSESKVVFSYLKGRILNALPREEYGVMAESFLGKALKLDPKFSPAWNELGDWAWKRGDLSGAKKFCTYAVENDPSNKEALRNLSMVMRHTGEVDKRKQIEESLKLVLKAISYDAKDGLSWSFLGNTYLSKFFNSTRDPALIRNALTAYATAEKDPKMRYQSDLFYNEAVALKYEESYQKCIEKLEYSCKLDPEWTAPREMLKSLIAFLETVHDLVATKGKVKTKRQAQMIKQLSEERCWGPYGKGVYKSPRGATAALKRTKLTELKDGDNLEAVVAGVVVASVNSQDYVPFLFCMVDDAGTCLAVTVYNLARGKGVIIGDTVALPDPYVESVAVKYNDKEMSVVAKQRELVKNRAPTLSLAGSRLSLQSRPSGDVSSIDGSSGIERKKRPSSAVPPFVDGSKTTGGKTTKKVKPKRPQSALLPKSDKSDAPKIMINIKPSIKPSVVDWGSEMSSEPSLGRMMQSSRRSRVSEAVPFKDPDLTFCASFLAARRTPDSVLDRKPMSRVQEWIEEIQALDIEEKNLEMLENAEADELAVMSIEEEVCEDEKEIDLPDSPKSKPQLDDDYFSILQTLQMLDANEPSSDTHGASSLKEDADLTSRPDSSENIKKEVTGKTSAGDYIDALGKISMMELELREKTNIIEDLKANLAEHRELLASNTKSANKELRQKLETQKKEFEASAKRHMNIIDQLVAEKRGLAERCDKLNDELLQMDKRKKEELNSLEERHAAELRRLRSLQSSADKLKRDKWIDEKTKEIKDMTVKGLQPEVQRMLDTHRAETDGLRAAHKAELKEVERRVRAEMLQEMERIKVEFHRDKELACMSEREIARQRIEKQFEEEEKLLQERRLKLLKQAEDEREKWENLVIKTRDEAQMQMQTLRQKYEMDLFDLREQLVKEEEKRTKEKEELMTNFAKELEQEKSKLSADFDAELDNAMKAKARDIEVETSKRLDALRREHLAEVERIRNELGEDFEIKLRRMKDKYTSEMEEMEMQEKNIHAKYFAAKSELTQVQEDLMRYKTSSGQMERELKMISSEFVVLQEEKKNMWSGIGVQFQAKIESLEDENRKLRLDLGETQDKLTRERRKREEDRESIKKEKEDEMEQVFKRVKFALDRKEESMNQLKQEYQDVLIRNQHLQGMLEKQKGDSSRSSQSKKALPRPTKAITMLKQLCPRLFKSRVILASSSPRRREILEKTGLCFETIVSDFDEATVSKNLPPEEFVLTAADGKASEVFRRLDDSSCLVVGSDSMICFRGSIFGKPIDVADAKRMLHLLSSSEPHEVLTGVTLIKGRGVEPPVKISFVEKTTVFMKGVPEEWLDAYLAVGESMDKAGAYGIQTAGACLVDRIEGDFYNVVGLPLSRLTKEFVELEIFC